MIVKYATHTHEITDPYKKILLNAKAAKIKIEPWDNNGTKLVICERKRHPYTFSVQNDTLTVRPAKNNRFDFLRIGATHSEIRLCVPTSALDAISVKANVGQVELSSLNCNGAIEIQINTGDVHLENVRCISLTSKGNCGCISLNNLIAKTAISIKRNTGKVLLNDCTTPEIFVKTNTGKVCGRLASNTAFAVRTNTGKIALPKTPVGEVIGTRCEITTNTGAIQFE